MNDHLYWLAEKEVLLEEYIHLIYEQSISIEKFAWKKLTVAGHQIRIELISIYLHTRNLDD
jgi:hypothetical protein